ncbi:hypothetical protein SAMN02745166_01510 [Prosthecobacter debontii]|uniref:Uncharacterized protein n=1 Tax=Prosthecobacter debontii TaxID=48467 RepID=A0A1T4XHE5_9BACT|nr:hypothetical protein [Prosthecobacter debontii]SKA88936.1 hypothetical protein SAMN02745166_01510 [Prosthecobacter debontii]
MKTSTINKTVKAWMQAGEPHSYAKERNMTQLSECMDSTNAELCQILYEFAQAWAKENPGGPGDTAPLVVHMDEGTVALFVRWGRRKGQPLFSPKRALRQKQDAPMQIKPKSGTPVTANHRQAFECWWRSEGRGLLYQDSAGRYTTDAARAARAAWQAAIPEVTRAPRLEDSDILAIHRQAYDLSRLLGHSLPQAELLAVSAVRRAIAHDLSFRCNTVSRCNLAEYFARCLTRKTVSDLDESQQRLIHKLTDGVLDHLGLSDFDEPKEPKDRDAVAFITPSVKPQEKMAA